jgi:hypothetical protein
VHLQIVHNYVYWVRYKGNVLTEPQQVPSDCGAQFDHHGYNGIKHSFITLISMGELMLCLYCHVHAVMAASVECSWSNKR